MAAARKVASYVASLGAYLSCHNEILLDACFSYAHAVIVAVRHITSSAARWAYTAADVGPALAETSCLSVADTGRSYVCTSAYLVIRNLLLSAVVEAQYVLVKRELALAVTVGQIECAAHVQIAVEPPAADYQRVLAKH